MSKSTKSPAAPATVLKLDGKTAAEIRAHLEAGETTAKAVVSYLSAKETLRAPSKKLLAELTGAAPVAPVKEVAKAAKEVAKATPVKVATPTDLLTATIAALTARVAALEAAAAPAKAEKVAPVVAAPPVKAKAAKVVATTFVVAAAPVKAKAKPKLSVVAAEIAAELVDF